MAQRTLCYGSITFLSNFILSYFTFVLSIAIIIILQFLEYTGYTPSSWPSQMLFFISRKLFPTHLHFIGLALYSLALGLNCPMEDSPNLLAYVTSSIVLF